MAAPTTSTLTLEIVPGDEVVIEGVGVRLELVHKSGRAARLRVTAPRNAPIRKQIAQGDDTHPVGAVPSMAT